MQTTITVVAIINDNNCNDSKQQTIKQQQMSIIDAFAAGGNLPEVSLGDDGLTSKTATMAQNTMNQLMVFENNIFSEILKKTVDNEFLCTTKKLKFNWLKSKFKIENYENFTLQ